MLESDQNHYASHQLTQCNTHQSTQCNTHQSTQCNTHQSTRYSCHWRELPQVFFVATKQNTSFVTTKVCLLQQTYFCHGKTFVTTNFGKVATNVFVVTKQIFCCDISMQKFYCDKQFCRDKTVVVPSILLLRQTCVCRDKSFAATKMVLVPMIYAAPTSQHSATWWSDGILSSDGT